MAMALFQSLSGSKDGTGIVSKDGTGIDSYEAITFYVMGSVENPLEGNFWVSQNTWPQTTPLALYLDAGDGLSTAAPDVARGSRDLSKQYRYDPSNPVPTVGGPNLIIPCGPLDQSSTLDRDDVLLFESAPFPDHVAVVGELKVVLFVSSDMLDTDFTAKLMDVDVNGSSTPFLLADGIVRMRTRFVEAGNSNVGYSLMTGPEGDVYEIELSLYWNSFVISQGHSLKLAISSSNYPRFSVNKNNGQPLANEDEAPSRIATNSVFFGPSYPSRVELPSVSLAELRANEVEM
jgi:putative CocE/NonD family hydrolase